MAPKGGFPRHYDTKLIERQKSSQKINAMCRKFVNTAFLCNAAGIRVPLNVLYCANIA
jgi:hypothetical protein